MNCDTCLVFIFKQLCLPAAGDVVTGLGSSSDAAVPIALVTKFLRLDDTVVGGGATAGIPGEELSKLVIVGLLAATLW